MDRESAVDISRRTALKRISFLACAVPISLLAMAGSSEAEKKATKAEAKYQDKPMGEQRCGSCVHFMPPNICDRIEGDVSPSGWCKFYKART